MGAKLAAESHAWPLGRIGEISKALGIGCEYRHLPVYQISEWPRSDPKHDEDVKELKEEVENAKSLHMDVEFRKDFAVKGWDGKVDQRNTAISYNQATFHPPITSSES